MRPPVELSLDLPPVAIPAAILNEVCAHAREAYPDEECCGLVTGDERQRYRRVWRCRNEQTAYHRRNPSEFPRDGRAAFLMNARDYMEAESRAEKEGERVTAVYHSHLDCGAYFSALDQEYAEHELFPFPDADHLVVSVVGGRTAANPTDERKVGEVGLFRRDGAAGRFVGRLVVPAPS